MNRPDEALLQMRSLLLQMTKAFLPDYLRLVEPDTAPHFLAEQATFPDLSALTDGQRQAVGTVALVPNRAGDRSTTVLIQPEIEPLGPSETARRFGELFLALETRLVQPVLLSVFYLRGGRPGPNLESTAVATVHSMEVVRIFYTAFGLAEARADHYVDRPEPLAWALAAAMRPVRFSPQELGNEALRRIAGAKLEPAHRKLLEAFINAAAAVRAGRDSRGQQLPGQRRHRSNQAPSSRRKSVAG